ncbi:MAG: hypothetical protein C5B46_02740 [Proteobacteria bacterium]|nr:MAG: hypothetical protein C5B46_02740 [Pseudomonadota bacterium]
MTTIKLMKSLLITVLLVSAVARAQSVTPLGIDQLSSAGFRIGDSNCELQDDQIRCTPIGR